MVVYWFFFPPVSKALKDISLSPLGPKESTHLTAELRTEANSVADELLFLPAMASHFDPPLYTRGRGLVQGEGSKS